MEKIKIANGWFYLFRSFKFSLNIHRFNWCFSFFFLRLLRCCCCCCWFCWFVCCKSTNFSCRHWNKSDAVNKIVDAGRIQGPRLSRRHCSSNWKRERERVKIKKRDRIAGMSSVREHEKTAAATATVRAGGGDQEDHRLPTRQLDNDNCRYTTTLT